MRARSLFPTFLVLLLASSSFAQVSPFPLHQFGFADADDYQTGTPQGDAHIIWDDDRRSFVLNPEGDGSYLETGGVFNGVSETAITVAAWIKTDSLADLDTVASYGYEWRLYADASLNMAFEVGNTQPSSRVIGSRTVNDGVWHHVAGTYDGSRSRLYVDGQLDASVNASGPIGVGGSGYTGAIGALYKNNDGAARNFFSGLIDDVRIYDVALTADQVSDLVKVPTASRPTPADGQTDVVQDVILDWAPGDYAAKHNVYFGMSPDDLSTASLGNTMGVLVSAGQAVNNYDPEGLLPFGQTYYWRVDEVNAAPDNTIFGGAVWSFTVEPYSIAAEGVGATASSSQPGFGPENTVNGSGLDGAGLHGTADETMWLSTAGDPAAWIQYEFESAYKLDKMLVWNSNQVIESFVGFGAKGVTVEVSTNGTDWTVVENVNQFAQAPGIGGYAANTTVEFGGALVQFVRISVNSGYGPLGQYGLSEVRFLYIPTFARQPQPADGAVTDGVDVVLSWRAGREAVLHDVYLGADSENLTLVGPTTDTMTTVNALDLDHAYYWQVVEINEASSPATYIGEVWSFTTAASIIVDDFESYQVVGPEDPAAIYNVWADGFVDPTNGSLVGTDPANDDYSPETIIVFGGDQSLPIWFDNSAAAQSEAMRTFDAPMDWTGNGIGALRLCFHGSGNNTGGSLYVKINNTKVAYAGDLAALMRGGWNEWIIPLADVAGDLSRVTSLTIGIDGGGMGVVYIDDIHLVR